MAPCPDVSWIPDAELCSDPGAIGFEPNSNTFRATSQDGERCEITTSNTTEITASTEKESTLPGTMLLGRVDCWVLQAQDIIQY